MKRFQQASLPLIFLVVLTLSGCGFLSPPPSLNGYFTHCGGSLLLSPTKEGPFQKALEIAPGHFEGYIIERTEPKKLRANKKKACQSEILAHITFDVEKESSYSVYSTANSLQEPNFVIYAGKGKGALTSPVETKFTVLSNEKSCRPTFFFEGCSF